MWLERKTNMFCETKCTGVNLGRLYCTIRILTQFMLYSKTWISLFEFEGVHLYQRKSDFQIHIHMGQMKNKFGFNIIHVVCTQVSFKLSGSFIEGIQTFTSLFYRYDRTTFPRKKRCLQST